MTNNTSAVLFLIMLILSSISHADQIDEELIKQKNLNALKHKINVAKSETELARTLQECRGYGGCLDSLDSLDSLNSLGSLTPLNSSSKDDQDQDQDQESKSSTTLAEENIEKRKNSQIKFNQLMEKQKQDQELKLSAALAKEKREKEKRSQIALNQLMQKIDSLSVDAIINKQVVFATIDGVFRVGEIILGSVQILKITDTEAHLGINNKPVKIVRMDWIKD